MQTLSREIAIEEHALDNGLRVVLSEDHSIPVAAVAVYYDVGSRNEEKGRTGFAHLFEHMMFEGSENAPKTMHMKYISAAGGSMNGTTSEERTNYYETVPSDKLPLALWLEADRMRSLKITVENFENQRETVKEERRQGIDNQPYGEVWLKIREYAIENWSYSHPVIGLMEDLDAADVEDARAFFKTYYAPNNAVLCITGDVDPKHVLDLVRQLFGDIPSSEAPGPVNTSGPEHTEEKCFEIIDPKIALPGLLVAYHIPTRRHPDSYPVYLLKQILFEGKSARLYKRLLEDEEAAIECYSYAENSRGPALLPMWFISRDPDNGRLKKLLDEEIARLHDGGVSERELQRSKNALKSDYVQRVESCLWRALLMAEFKLYDNDPSLINSELNRYLEVTLDDVNRVAGKYFIRSNRTVLDVMPGKQPEPNAQPEEK